MAKRTTRRRDKEDEGDNYWQEAWDARQRVFEELLGPAEDRIYTSMFPVYLGGLPDVMTFKKHAKGYTYVTAGLTVTSGQKRSKLGQYELMMCSRKADRAMPGVLSGLAGYTLEHKINPGDTIDLGEDQPKGVTLRALLATEFDPPRGRFKLMGKRCGLILLIGITAAELVAYRSGKRRQVTEALKQFVWPYTDPKRKPVI